MINKSKCLMNYNIFLPALLLIPVTALQISEENGNCDVDMAECGRGIDMKECNNRGCCFMPSVFHLHNCFFHPTRANSPKIANKRIPVENFAEIPPPGAVTLSYEQRKQLEQLTKTGKDQLTPDQAIHIANVLESFLFDHAKNGGKNINWNYHLKDIFYAEVKTNRATFLDEVRFKTGNTIQLDSNIDIEAENISVLIYVEYLTIPRLLRGSQTTLQKTSVTPRQKCQPMQEIVEDASLISVTAYNSQNQIVSVPLSFSMNEINDTKLESNRQGVLSCEYVDEANTTNTTTAWSPFGCHFEKNDEKFAVCRCNHTTKFSILFLFTPLPFEVTDHHVYKIRILEFIMESLSFTCLFITFLSLVLVLRRRSKSSSSASERARERIIVHINFTAALSILHLLRLFSEAALSNDGLCAFIAVMSHYFMLASGMWMLMEGVVLYLNLILKSMKFTKLGWYKFGVGWGIPTVVVFISAVYGLATKNYVQKIEPEYFCPSENNQVTKTNLPIQGPYEYCWLSNETNMIWAATGPLICIFIVNIAILTHTVIFILQLSLKSDNLKPSGHKSKNFKHLWHTTKGIIVLLPILGIPWLFGFLVNVRDRDWSIAFQYIHVSLNGLQGVFIFILYCGVNKEVRVIIHRLVNNKWQQHKISTSRSNYNSSGNNSLRRFKKSISSLMGHTSTPNRKNSYYPNHPQSNMSQQSINTHNKQSSNSGSQSSIPYRFKRKYSAASLIATSGLHPGFTGSLPRGWGYRPPRQVTRTSSTRSLRSEASRNNSIPRICNRCGALKKNCGHVESVSAVNNPDLVEYDFYDDTIGKEPPPMPSRWQRMTAEEFKRFSAIPEEKRRSGVNSFILENSEAMTLAAHAWDNKAKTLERSTVAEKHGKMFVKVDIHDIDFEKRNSDVESTKKEEHNSGDVVTSSDSDTSISGEETIPYKHAEEEKTNPEITFQNFKSKLTAISSKVKVKKKKFKHSIPTPTNSKRKSERLSAYGERLMTAVEKWKTEEKSLREKENKV